jgi:hypothetical protein
VSSEPPGKRDFWGWATLAVAVGGAAYGIVASFVSLQHDQAEEARAIVKIEQRLERLERDRELMDRIRGLETQVVEMRSDVQWVSEDLKDLKQRRR